MRRSGGNLEHHTSLGGRWRIGRDVELGKCTILALGTGASWVPKGKPNRRPPRARVDVLSINLRMGEYLEAEKAEEHTE